MFGGLEIRERNYSVFPARSAKILDICSNLVQTGQTPPSAKPMRGIESGVFEIVSDYATNTYRAVYTVKIGRSLYVLHVFQKKSKRGIATPKRLF